MTNYAPPPPGEYQPVQPMSPSDEKLWSTLVHVAGVFFGVLPALIGYLVLKERGPFVRAHTQTALNFQITMAIATVVGIITSFILIGFLVLMAVGVLIIVFSIIAAVKANNGEFYTYPMSIPFIK